MESTVLQFKVSRRRRSYSLQVFALNSIVCFTIIALMPMIASMPDPAIFGLKVPSYVFVIGAAALQFGLTVLWATILCYLRVEEWLRSVVLVNETGITKTTWSGVVQAGRWEDFVQAQTRRVPLSVLLCFRDTTVQIPLCYEDALFDAIDRLSGETYMRDLGVVELVRTLTGKD